jgi:hypothetical protein
MGFMSKLFKSIVALIPGLTDQAVHDAVASVVAEKDKAFADYQIANKSAYEAVLTAFDSGDREDIDKALNDYESLIGEGDTAVSDNTINAPAIVAAVLATPDTPVAESGIPITISGGIGSGGGGGGGEPV